MPRTARRKGALERMASVGQGISRPDVGRQCSPAHGRGNGNRRTGAPVTNSCEQLVQRQRGPDRVGPPARGYIAGHSRGKREQQRWPRGLPRKSRLLVTTTKCCVVAPTPGLRRPARSRHRWWTSGQPRTRDAPAARPSLATGSCPRRCSRLAQRNFNFLCPPHGVRQGLGDVFGFQIGILAKNLVPGPSCGDEPDTWSPPSPVCPDARLFAH